MAKELRMYVLDALEACTHIFEYTAGRDLEGFRRVEAKRVWDVLAYDLPRLRDELEAWLQELDPDLR